MAVTEMLAQGQVADAIDALAAAVRSLNVAVITGDNAAGLTELFARGERLCLAGKALTARRATVCGEWSRRGFRSREEWLASVSGTPMGPARAVLEVADRMVALPEFEEAVKGGELFRSPSGRDRFGRGGWPRLRVAAD